MRTYRLAVFLTLVTAGRVFAQPAEVIIIRHAEKPEEGSELSLKGRERAAALAPYFAGNADLLKFGTPIAVYAQAQKKETSSVRSAETVQPFAESIHVKISNAFTREQWPDMVDEIKHQKRYEGHTVVICWEHNVIPEIAATFGAEDAPHKWKGDTYDRAWVLTFTTDGHCTFRDLPQRLMYGDSEN
jgi:hypothetical protein